MNNQLQFKSGNYSFFLNNITYTTRLSSKKLTGISQMNYHR